MRLNRYLLIIAFIFVSVAIVVAQTKEDLKIQKSKIQKEIGYMTSLLNKTKSNKTKSLNYLIVLEAQIKSREDLLRTLNIEIRLLSKKIKKTVISITEIENMISTEEQSLINLKNEYAKMIYAAFKQKGKRNDLMFIISANDFNQAYKRILYLKQYSVFRKNQSLKIIESQSQLIIKKEKLAQQKDRLIEESATKTHLLGFKKEELTSINTTKNEKKNL